MNGDTAPVPYTGGSDLTLQLTEEVVNDLVRRQLSDPLTIDPHSPAFLPRRILKNEVQSHLPYALDWGLPQLSCAEGDLLAAAIPLSGGVRPPALNRNLTVSASATVRAPVRVASDDTGAPYAAIDAAAAKALELGDAKLGYALAELPAPVPAIDFGSVAGLLRPAIAPALLESLSRVRLSYALDSLPLHLLGMSAGQNHQRDQKAWVFKASRAGACVIIQGEDKALALGVTLAKGALGDQAPMSAATPAFPKTPASNIALTLSNTGMNRLLAQLETAGRLRGTAALRMTGHPVEWAWEELTCAFEDGVVAVAGRFITGALVDDVRLLLTCSLGQRGELMVTPVGGVINPTLNDLATESFRTLLERLFRAAGAHKGEAGLWQRFTIPGMRVNVEAPAVAITLAHNALTFFYQAPLKPDLPSLPDVHLDPLTVAITQTDMPAQAAPGTPVSAELDAMIAGGIEPFDVSWSASPPGTVTDTHDRVAHVRGVPAGLGGDGAVHPLAEARVRVADLLGRTATATGTARYRAAPQRRQTQPPRPRPPLPSPLRFVLPAIVIIALLTGGGVALAKAIIPSPPGLPPTLDVSPSTAYQQTCTPVSPALLPISVTLDNSRNAAAIDWSAKVQGTAPGSSSEPWATLDETSGTIGGGHAHTVAFTPQSDLCSAIFHATGGQSDFAVIVTYRLAGRGSLQSGDLDARGALSLAPRSRQITLTDTIFAVNFGAYVGSGERPALELLQTCHDSSDSSAPPVSSFPITLDNSRSSAAVQWTLAIADEAMVGATPDAGMEPWVTTSTPSGSLDAGQRAQVVVSPLPDLCRRIPPGTAAVPFNLTVTVNGVAPITLLDVISPPAPVATLTVTPVSLKQDCSAKSVTSFAVALDNTLSNVPVNWQASIVESLTIGHPTYGTPTPPTIEPWATLDVSSGVLKPGSDSAVTLVVTPSTYVCGTIAYTAPATVEDFHVLITYSATGDSGGAGGAGGAGAGSATGAPPSGAVMVTDQVTGYRYQSPG